MEMAGVAGSGFGKAMERYNNVVSVEGFPRVREDTEFQKKLIEEMKEVAKSSIERAIDFYAEHGFTWEKPDDVRDIAPKVLRAVEKFPALDPTPADWVVECVEQPMPDHGWCKADVVYRTPEGTRIVVDYKFKFGLKSDYLAKTIEAFGRHPQRWQYLWAHEAVRFDIYLVIQHPFKIHTAPFDRDEERLAQWLASQRTKWGLMSKVKEGELEPWENDSHETKYGPCMMEEACLTYHRDPERMRFGGYIRIDPKERRKST